MKTISLNPYIFLCKLVIDIKAAYPCYYPLYLSHLDTHPDGYWEGEDDEEHGGKGEETSEEASTPSLIISSFSLPKTIDIEWKTNIAEHGLLDGVILF